MGCHSGPEIRGQSGYPLVTLAEARTKALANRSDAAQGRDPVAETRRRTTPTFREAAAAVHEVNRPRWRNAHHTASWMQTLERHAFGTLGAMAVHRIHQGDVLRVLEPIWTTKPETARRVRQRIRTVLAWAQAQSYIDNNPADGRIDPALPRMPNVKAHLRALDYREVPAAPQRAEDQPAVVGTSTSGVGAWLWGDPTVFVEDEGVGGRRVRGPLATVEVIAPGRSRLCPRRCRLCPRRCRLCPLRVRGCGWCR